MSDPILSRNNVVIEGEGSQTLIFAHGFGFDQRTWRFTQPELAKNYRTVLFDHVGSGRSRLSTYIPERYASASDYARDVLEICGALDIRDAIFIGHSFSGMVGAAAAIREPERFSHLIMIGANARFINDPPDYEGGFERSDILDLMALMDRNIVEWANFLAPVAMGSATDPEFARELTDSFCSAPPSVLRHFAEVVFFGDNRAMLPQCPASTLLLQCRDDAFVPASTVEFMQSLIPDCHTRYIEANGHCPHVSHPRETIDLISDYLSANRA